jgi:hypothetical protein
VVWRGIGANWTTMRILRLKRKVRNRTAMQPIE